KGFVAHAVDDVIHFEHGLRKLGFALDERLQGPAHHGADGGGHAADIDRQLYGRQVDQVHDALGDIYSLIAYALEVGVDLGDGQNKAQIDGRRLLRGQDVEGQFVNFALGGVDQAL